MNPNFVNTVDNGAGSVNPFRLTITQARTADQSHSYNTEQISFNKGAMDKFPNAVGRSGPLPTSPVQALTTGLTMGYYDGNTVTAFWNYAQHFAIGDPDPIDDVCSTSTGTKVRMAGKNIGDLLNTAGVTSGFKEASI